MFGTVDVLSVSKSPPPRKDGNAPVFTDGRSDAKDLHTVPTSKHVVSKTKAQPPLRQFLPNPPHWNFQHVGVFPRLEEAICDWRRVSVDDAYVSISTHMFQKNSLAIEIT